MAHEAKFLPPGGGPAEFVEYKPDGYPRGFRDGFVAGYQDGIADGRIQGFQDAKRLAYQAVAGDPDVRAELEAAIGEL